MFAVSFPGQDALMSIYSTILGQHLAVRNVSMVVQKVNQQLVSAALGKHCKKQRELKQASLLMFYLSASYSYLQLAGC